MTGFAGQGRSRIVGKDKLPTSKGRDATGNYIAISPTLLTGKVTKQTKKHSVCKHHEGNKFKLIKNSRVFVRIEPTQ